MLKILGRDTSSNVMKVLWASAELGVDFERENIGGKHGGNDTAEFRSLNPNGLVPVIVDDDFVNWESNSCVRYLAAKHDYGGLYPEDIQVRAVAERWMDWQVTTVSPAMIPVFRGMIRTRAEDRDIDAIETGRASLSAKMAIINDELADRSFLTGDDFNMGDIPLGIAVWRWFNMPIEREDYPHLKRWCDALCERPGYREHIMKPVA
jgi:glutathione S-transferase|tara:strand:- start:17 stop:637 length:621 start_codon:yes stop_codon:yes gene_type:complete